MVIYPVIDLKGGLVVRGVGGERSLYRPVESLLATSAEPVAVARAFRERLGLDRLYVADLDALGGAPPAAGVLASLHEEGFRLLVDAGARSAEDAMDLARFGADEVVAPLETLPDPAALEGIVGALGAGRVVFSLDLKGGRLLGDRGGWPHRGPMEVAREALRRGARRVLLLDLAQVGSGRGPAHLDLLAVLAREPPRVEVLAGGGVRSAGDLEQLERAGVHGVLVASAFHAGAISRADIDRVCGPPAGGAPRP